MKLLIATKNPAKQEDYKTILKNFGVKSVSLKDLNDPDDVEEVGTSLKENAILKAVYFSKKHGLPAIADDNGFEIDALGGEPGIYARRWPGYEATDRELRKMVVEKLDGVPLEKRTAKFTNVTVLADKNGKVIASGIGHITGYIPLKISNKTTKGFPYRSVLFVTQYNKFWIDLTPKEYEQIGFRYKAIKQLIPKIRKVLL